MKKPAALSAGLVSVKGGAVPVENVPPRSASLEVVKAEQESGLQPLNFKVKGDFRREFKTFAAAHDMKLNELLKASFDAYRKQKGG